MEHCILKIALDSPLDSLFDYQWKLQDETVPLPRPGQLAIVPFGRREVVGIIVAVSDHSDLPAEKLREALAVHVQVPPLSREWLDLCRFAADYYHRPLGEVAIPGLPKNLRTTKTTALDKALAKLARPADVALPRLRKAARARGRNAAITTPVESPAQAEAAVEVAEPAALASPVFWSATPNLNAAQEQAVASIAETMGFTPYLLFGVTGSGKTEVYLQAAARIFAQAHSEGPPAQVLILVPEINLTPQWLANVQARFPHLTIALLHSGLAEGERLTHWLAAHYGRAQIVLGTRLAILASLPNLKLIVVDEEHDPSYKQQEGLRYSARDLAVWRAHQLGIPVVLGSATPSLESWQHVQSGRYKKLELRERAVPDAVLPKVRMIDMERDRPTGGMTSSLIKAVRLRLECGEQSLLFLNRRGYAPVMACEACGWISNCAHCSAFMVLHKLDRKLRCHHCSNEMRIPRNCPTCGNIDLQPIGRGTQRVEESLQQLFPAARIQRIDADSTRLKGSAQAAFDAVHRGEVDILIGTQMVAKGHDFQNLTLVGVLNPDTALFSQDYRAAERLFAQLMQVAGRAGRRAQKEDGNPSEVWIQTRYPQHPLYAALRAHDYERFADVQLQDRVQAGLPPFIYQALMRAEARELQTALEFLEAARSSMDLPPEVILHDPIPMAMTRVANVERAQLLIESTSRVALQAYLTAWLPVLREIKPRIKWSLEVDPQDI
ncbi:replication restart DNA helicase PriA [Paucimonas lemoignei]|uniref:Replication restart protein PriA n=1 Tax=Paucimonas lemoignei TaxID=29443 RepID=A0A4R3HSX5_PAULE|nr:primosomal protein N' [Paucimonas lemoignei]TCS35573.1 replication restart DNA helicase PriA [Paucimonas lemoignei]